MAQGEHGGLSTVLFASDSPDLLDAVESKIRALATDDWPRPAEVALVLVR